MKIEIRKLNNLIKKYPKHKLYNIGKNKYIEIITFKHWIICLKYLLLTILGIPYGIVLALLELMNDIIEEIPDLIKVLIRDILNVIPLRYIKVVDDTIK